MATARAQGPRAASTRPRLRRCRTGASSRLTLSPRPGTGVTSAGPGVHRHPGPEGLSLATWSVRGPCSDTEREPWRGPGMPGRCPGRAPVLKSKPRSRSATGAPPSERTPSGAESRPAPRLGGGSQRPLPSGCPEGRGEGQRVEDVGADRAGLTHRTRADRGRRGVTVGVSRPGSKRVEAPSLTRAGTARAAAAPSRPQPRGGSSRPGPRGSNGRASPGPGEPLLPLASGPRGEKRSCTRRSAGYRHAARATLSSRTRGAPRSRRARRQTRQGCGRTAGQT